MSPMQHLSVDVSFPASLHSAISTTCEISKGVSSSFSSGSGTQRTRPYLFLSALSGCFCKGNSWLIGRICCINIARGGARDFPTGG